jgi:hypothetical protein
LLDPLPQLDYILNQLSRSDHEPGDAGAESDDDDDDDDDDDLEEDGDDLSGCDASEGLFISLLACFYEQPSHV